MARQAAVSCSAPCCRETCELRGPQVEQWHQLKDDPKPLLLYCPACRPGRFSDPEGCWRYYQVLERSDSTPMVRATWVEPHYE